MKACVVGDSGVLFGRGKPGVVTGKSGSGFDHGACKGRFGMCVSGSPMLRDIELRCCCMVS